jgi:DsbC/DsbD-like thiol-disulfide interchange protein
MKRCLIMVFGVVGGIAVAADENPLEVQLISEASQITPGATFHVGLHLKHPPGYHSYWKHPGVVGVPTSVEWTLPDGFVAGEIQWPAPEKVMMAIYAAQGYHGETTLIVPMTASPDLVSETATLEARVSWMCCGKACSPASDVPFTIEIAVGDELKIDSEVQPLFAKARAAMARPDPDWQATAKREDGRIVLRLKPTGSAKLPDGVSHQDLRFFTEDGQVETDQPQEIRATEDGEIEFSLAIWEFSPDNPATLPGVIRSTNDAEFTLAVNPAY